MDVHFAYVSPHPLAAPPCTSNAGTPASIVLLDNKRFAAATSLGSRMGRGEKGGVGVSTQVYYAGG